MVKWREAFLWALVLLVILSVANAAGSDPQFRRRINCEKLKDGNYVFGCSRFYSMCTNGIEYPMHCFDNLVINPANNQCDAPKDVSICQKSGDTKLYRSKDPFTCAGRADGNYEAQICSAFYYQCLGGQQFERPCPQGLAYSPKQNVCDFIDKCKQEAAGRQNSVNLEIVDPDKGNADPNAANANANLNRRSSNNYKTGAARRSAASNGYPSAPQGPTYQQPAVSAPAPQPIESSVVDDGFIVDETGENSSGQEAPIQPSSYASAPQQAAPQPTPPAAQSNSYWGSGSTQPAKGYASPPSPQTPVFDCSGKEDGVYLKDSSTCTDTFYKCSNANGFQYTCPATLFYNVDNNQCDHKQNVVACGGQAQPPTTTAAPSLDYTATRKPVAFDCSGKADGYYQPEICSSVFFSCIGGLDSQINCPAGTVFDITNLICDYPSQCGQPRTTPASQVQSQAISHGNTDYYMQQQNQPAQQVQQTQQYQAPPATQAPPQQAAPVAAQPVHQPAQQYLVPQPSPQVPQQQAPQPAYQTVQQTPVVQRPAGYGAPAAVAQSPSFSCAGKQDGYYYKKPCTASFLICSAGQVSTETCPGNLVFDPSVAYCQYPDVCGKPTPSTTVAPPQMVYPEQAPVSAIATTTKPTSDFDCSGLPDGYTYKKPCTTTFYTCASGHTIELHCPASLVFDPTTSSCLYPDECGQPKKQQPVQTAPVAQNPAPKNYYTPPAAYTTAPVPTTTTPIPTTQAYYAPPPAPVQQQPAPVYVPAPVQQQPQTYAPAPAQQQQPAGGLNCVGKTDGYYWKQQCTATYYSCNGGHTMPMQCPSGLVFDPVIMQCDWPTECGKPATIAPTPSPVQQQPVPVYAPAPVQQQPQTYAPAPAQQQQPAGGLNCVGKTDGYYWKQQCTATYYSCNGGNTIPMQCPSGLVFDPVIMQCDWPTQCGKPATTTSAPPTMASAPQQNQQLQYGYQRQGYSQQQAAPQQAAPQQIIYQQGYQQQQVARQPQQPKNFSCNNRIDGYYIKKSCTTPYFSCVGGMASQLACPAGLVFDVKTASCEYPEQCGKTATTTVASPVANPAPTPAPVNYDCSNKAEGYYSQAKCQNQYVSCVHGQAYQYACPGQLVFNGQTGSCDYLNSCLNPSQSSAPTPPAAVQQPYQTNQVAPSAYSQQQVQQQPSSNYGSQPQQAAPITATTQPPVPASEFDCSQRETGYYSKGCSGRYYSCHSGSTYAFQCPSDLMYSQTIAACDHVANVPECGGKPPQQPTSQQSNTQTYGQQYGQQQTMAPPQMAPSGVNCGSMTKGTHESAPCSAKYLTCWNGKLGQANCYNSLVYNPLNGQCDYPVNVQGCAQFRAAGAVSSQVPHGVTNSAYNSS